MSGLIGILLAGGSGERMQASVNKVFLTVGGKTCFRRSLEAFEGLVDHMVIVIRPGDEERVRQEVDLAAFSAPVICVSGGPTRQASVLNGLQALPFSAGDFVLVHDAARCLVTPDLIRRVIASCRQHGSGIPAVPVIDTLKSGSMEGLIQSTPDRSSLFAVQTPQGLPAITLRQLSEQASADGFLGTDDASLFEHYGEPVFLCAGDRRNLKLTTREDLIMAEAYLDSPSPFRVGQGYDVHRLVPDRKLILCGVDIPWEQGLLGHSDADVALHALMDAMLGAAALGDIGQHFPDTDERYRGISSIELLKATVALLREKGFSLSNADVTIVAQRPKLLPFIPQMRQNIASVCALPLERVSVKATTTEKLGFEGRMEGISAQAVCLLTKG